MMLELSFLDAIQNMILNKIPPTGLLNVKASVYRVLNKTGSELRNTENRPKKTASN